jgi:DUF917 family protein
MIKLDSQLAEAAVLGGSVFGGGGGGWVKEGLQIAKLALKVGEPQLISIDEIAENATLVTVSAVGSQAAERRFIKPMHYVRAVTLLAEKGERRIDGFISSENGAVGSVNGWFQSAVLKTPVIDAPCNGRAHPTGVMGSMGLDNLDEFVSIQAIAGGNSETGNYVEMFIEACIDKAANVVRYASSLAGGMVAVARNPVEASYVKTNGAPGAILQAIKVGRALQEKREKGAESMIRSVVDVIKGTQVIEGTMKEVTLRTTGGFDVGKAQLVDIAHHECELTFWNEYMTLDVDGERLATFPDLIVTMSLETGLPLISGEMRRGLRVAILYAPKESLKLGAGMRNPELFRQVESVITKPIVEYVFNL